jgi:hypothetical protein
MSEHKAFDRQEIACLDNAWFVDFPTEPAGVLRLGPGPVKIAYRFSLPEASDEDWWALVDCTLRLSDAGGQVWQATSHMLSPWLLYPLIDLSRRQPARFLENSPAAWRKALSERPLMEKVPATYDDRFYRYVWLDNMGVSLQFKYMGAYFSVAALDGGRLVVAVKDVFCCWNPVRLEGPRGAPLPVPKEPAREPSEEEEEEGGDYDEMPALAYEIDVGRVLFHNTARRDEDEHWSDDNRLLPLLFLRTGEQAEPQPAVTYQAGAHLTATALPDDVSKDGTVQVPLPPYNSMVLLTDAGGRLEVDWREEGSAELWLGRHPGCGGEPVDVVCCRLRLADAAGDLWEGYSLFTPDFFLKKFIDLDRGDDPGWARQPEEPAEREALEKSFLVRGLRGLVGDGAWRYALVADGALAFRGRGQKFTVDLALSEEKEHVIVRVNGLVGRRRPVEIDHESRYIALDPPDRAEERNAWKRDAPIPSLVYALYWWELLARNTTFAVDDGFFHGNPIPIPVVFRRVGKAKPQAKVRFVPGFVTGAGEQA